MLNYFGLLLTRGLSNAAAAFSCKRVYAEDGLFEFTSQCTHENAILLQARKAEGNLPRNRASIEKVMVRADRIDRRPRTLVDKT